MLAPASPKWQEKASGFFLQNASRFWMGWRVGKYWSNIKQILEGGGNVEDANKLVHGGKEHNHSYLVGRVNRKRLSKKKCTAATTTPVSSASSDQLAELTAKICEQLAHEMDEKVNKKVRENVKLMMAKIVEKNPDLKVDMDDLSGEPSIDDVST